IPSTALILRKSARPRTNGLRRGLVALPMTESYHNSRILFRHIFPFAGLGIEIDGHGLSRLVVDEAFRGCHPAAAGAAGFQRLVSVTLVDGADHHECAPEREDRGGREGVNGEREQAREESDGA